MIEVNIYMPLWQKYKVAIVDKLRKAINESQQYQLTGYEFEAVGDRKLSGYDFLLEISNGSVINDISGSAVARDLFEVLKQSKTAKDILVGRHFKINLNPDFKLIIQTVQIKN